MVTSTTMYKSYKASIWNEVSRLRDEIVKVKTYRTKIKDIIHEHAEVIASNTPYTARRIRCNALYSSRIELPISPDSSARYIELLPSLRGNFELVFKCNKKIEVLTRNIERLKTNLVPASVFTAVIREYNLNIIKGAVTANTMKLGNKLGELYIKEKLRFYSDDPELSKFSNSRNVDWGKSSKFKKRLISQGKLPLVNIKDDKGNIIGDNGGVEWMIHNAETYGYWYHWRKSGINLTHIAWYVFKPTYYNNEEHTTEKMKTMTIDDSLFNLNLGAADKAIIYRNINPSIKIKYIKHHGSI